MNIVCQDIPSGSVLGINYGGLHDSAIAIVAPDGTPVFGMSLERVTRNKQDGRPPYSLLEQVPWDRISKVALSSRLANDSNLQSKSALFDVTLRDVRQQTEFQHPETYKEFVRRIPCETVEVCHHLTHTASAYWGSGFENALCLTYDGGVYTNPWFGGLYLADRKRGIEAVDMFNRFFHPNVADLYSFVTAVLGFTPNRHEGKITGLAAYGTPSPACRALISDWYENNIALKNATTSWIFSNEKDLPPIGYVNDARIEPFRKDASRFSREELAATLQEFCENHIVTLLSRARDHGWSGNQICLAGGLFANVKINQRVLEMGFDDIFIAPPMTDDGTALGAAWHVLSTQHGFAPPPMQTAYLGPSFSTTSISDQLTVEGVKFQTVEEPAGHLASLLANGAIVAVFQGAMELGPRALGNRSILAQAINPGINQSLNARLNRTEFMPFAPVSRIEDATKCYANVERITRAAAFMTITTDCTSVMTALCPAVVHVDGTARPQLVSATSNPLIHTILTHYQMLTGRPALVNTSFNIHEEPIVCTPQDALKGFFESGLDYLFLGDNLLVSFEENKEVAIRYLQARLSQPSQRAETLSRILGWQFTQHYSREEYLQKTIRSLHEQVAILEANVKAIETSRTARILKILSKISESLRNLFSLKGRTK